MCTYLASFEKDNTGMHGQQNIKFYIKICFEEMRPGREGGGLDAPNSKARSCDRLSWIGSQPLGHKQDPNGRPLSRRICSVELVSALNWSTTTYLIYRSLYMPNRMCWPLLESLKRRQNRVEKHTSGVWFSETCFLRYTLPNKENTETHR